MVISSSQLVGIAITYLLIPGRRGPHRGRRHPRPGIQHWSGSGRTALTTSLKILLTVERFAHTSLSLSRHRTRLRAAVGPCGTPVGSPPSPVLAPAWSPRSGEP